MSPRGSRGSESGSGQTGPFWDSGERAKASRMVDGSADTAVKKVREEVTGTVKTGDKENVS